MLSGKSATKTLKRYARHLLATTCLSAAAAATAQATSFSESIDFGNTFAARTTLPGGTDRVFGGINPSGDIDFFQFTGLAGGGNFTLFGIYENSARYSVLNSSGSVVGGNVLTNNPPTMSGIVPGDGILVVQVAQNEQIAGYDLRLNVVTPEPSTMGLAGLALAGAVALRRKKNQ